MYRAGVFFLVFFVITGSYSQTATADSLFLYQYKREINIPGGPGQKDSITTKYFYRKDHKYYSDGSLFNYYSSGALYEKETRVASRGTGTATGYYPDGKLYCEDYYMDSVKTPSDVYGREYSCDSVIGYYHDGRIYYKAYNTVDHIFHDADSSTGLDSYIDRATESAIDNRCKTYSIYCPGGSLMEEGAFEYSYDSVDLKTGGRWNPRNRSEDDYAVDINLHYGKTQKLWYLNGTQKQYVDYSNYENGTQKQYIEHSNYGFPPGTFYHSFQQWDSLSTLLMEGKSNGNPYILQIKWDPAMMNGMGERGVENKKYEELFIKYYPNGKPEWEMKGRCASALLSLNFENPNPEAFEGWKTLVHYSENGKVIRKCENK